MMEFDDLEYPCDYYEEGYPMYEPIEGIIIRDPPLPPTCPECGAESATVVCKHCADH